MVRALTDLDELAASINTTESVAKDFRQNGHALIRNILSAEEAAAYDGLVKSWSRIELLATTKYEAHDGRLPGM